MPPPTVRLKQELTEADVPWQAAVAGVLNSLLPQEAQQSFKNLFPVNKVLSALQGTSRQHKTAQLCICQACDTHTPCCGC